ncbi:MAG: 5-formyltetrahydrofolate cyclo-ligase [Aquificae bacterium]|nr:5-formyltetrahydrofolate cyclo-ligase [Aquificota bacterium]
MKDTIRKRLLKIRERYKNKIIDSIKIVRKILLLPEFRKAKAVLLYYPHKNEVDLRFLINYLLKQNRKSVLLPKVEEKTLKIIKISNISQLKKGFAGIKEPQGLPVSSKIIDVAIIPAVAFDIYGYRLGYGSGFYDRFLKDKKILKIGVAYDFQIQKQLPHDRHDVPVDVIVTPTRIIKPKFEKGGKMA